MVFCIFFVVHNQVRQRQSKPCLRSRAQDRSEGTRRMASHCGRSEEVSSCRSHPVLRREKVLRKEVKSVANGHLASPPHGKQNAPTTLLGSVAAVTRYHIVRTKRSNRMPCQRSRRMPSRGSALDQPRGNPQHGRMVKAGGGPCQNNRAMQRLPYGLSGEVIYELSRGLKSLYDSVPQAHISHLEVRGQAANAR